jgi:hypothetical protein
VKTAPAATARAAFCIYWGQVSADSHGPIEWCRPVPCSDAEALARHYPELNLRTDPAHRERPTSRYRSQQNPAQWQLASEALHAWAAEHAIKPEQLTLTPKNLRARITYFTTEPITDARVPDCNLRCRSAEVPTAVSTPGWPWTV